MADEAPKPAVGLSHNQVYIMLSGFLASVFVNYVVAKEQITTLNVKVDQLQKDKVEMMLLITKEADKNEKNRGEMKEAVIEMKTILKERKR